MTVPIKTKIVTNHKLSASEFRAISKEAWELAGEHWHQTILPKHFKSGAIREYRYQRRTRGYRTRKQRVVGHQEPLVFSGTLKRRALQTREVRGRGNTRQTIGRAQVVVRGPAYLTGGRRHNPRQPDIAAEIRALSNRDAKEIARVVDKALGERLAESGQRKEIRT